MLRKFFAGGGRLLRLAEGPIDKCGLAYFLSAKFTSLTTVAVATETRQQLWDRQGGSSIKRSVP